MAYKGVVALLVGFADLIPLVGATLGAIVAIAVAALHSLPAALVLLVFFVLYQQAENHLLQPVIMSRTVQLSALTVTIAILFGVELLGFLGALLAIPVAGILHVIGRDLYDGYRGRIKPEPPLARTRCRCPRLIHPTAPASHRSRPAPGTGRSAVHGRQWSANHHPQLRSGGSLLVGRPRSTSAVSGSSPPAKSLPGTIGPGSAARTGMTAAPPTKSEPTCMASCRIGLVVRVCVGMQCNSKR